MHDINPLKRKNPHEPQSVDFAHGADNSGIHREKDIERWAQDIYQFVSRKYGEANIVSFIVHLDELNPHIHCALLPINDRNKFAFKALFAGKDIYDYKRMTSQLHDELAAVNAKWGLERGTSVGLTGARHRSTEDYRRWLTEECTTLEEQLGNHRMALSDLLVEISIAEKKRKSFQTMVQNLCREKADINTHTKQHPFALHYGLSARYHLSSRLLLLTEFGGWTTFRNFDGDGDANRLGDHIYFFFRLGTDELTEPAQLLNVDGLAKLAITYHLKVGI